MNVCCCLRHRQWHEIEGFGEAVRAGKPLPGLLRQAYQASVASLLGEQAMDSNQAMTWPTNLVAI